MWLQLGEARALCERLAMVPLKEPVAEELMQVYLAKGARATTAIEGNTLSEKQVRAHIQGRLELPPSQAYLQHEIGNALNGYNMVLEATKTGEGLPVSLERIGEFNCLVLEGLEVEEGVVPGEIASFSRVVGGYRCPSPSDCRLLLPRLVEWLNGPAWTAPAGVGNLAWGIVKAIISHLYLVWIHPYGDGNGRTSRLLEFQILLTAGVPAPAAHLLSNHYNQTRAVYYKRLADSSRAPGGDVDFLAYVLEGFVDGLREQWKWVEAMQAEMAWEALVNEEFQRATGSTAARRRDLLLAMGGREPLAPEELIQVTPLVARHYGSKTQKTFVRDLNYLLGLGLVVKEGRTYRAATERVMALRPANWPGHTRNYQIQLPIGETGPPSG